MYKIKYWAKSNVDLDEIFDYISNDDNFQAVKVIHKIVDTIKNIQIFPYLWKPIWRFREFIETKYKFRIIYELDEDKKLIKIISVFKNKNNF